MNITVENNQKDLSIKKIPVKNIVKETLRFEGVACDEVSVHFISNEDMCALHEEYFDDPSPTDCISFPMDLDEDPHDPYRILGDIFVCPRTAIEYAQANGLDPLEETTLYIVHGLLHLMGYDDIDEADEKKMRAAELRHMKNLKSLDLCLSK